MEGALRSTKPARQQPSLHVKMSRRPFAHWFTQNSQSTPCVTINQLTGIGSMTDLMAADGTEGRLAKSTVELQGVRNPNNLQPV